MCCNQIDWYVVANMASVIAICGYVAMDIAYFVVEIDDIVYSYACTGLASIYVLDALLFFCLFWQSRDENKRCWLTAAFYAALLNVVGSCLYLASSICSFFSDDDVVLDIATNLDIAALAVFSVDCMCFALDWCTSTRPKPGRVFVRVFSRVRIEPEMWGNVFNVLPQVLYAIATIVSTRKSAAGTTAPRHPPPPDLAPSPRLPTVPPSAPTRPSASNSNSNKTEVGRQKRGRNRHTVAVRGARSANIDQLVSILFFVADLLFLISASCWLWDRHLELKKEKQEKWSELAEGLIRTPSTTMSPTATTTALPMTRILYADDDQETRFWVGKTHSLNG